MPAQRRGVGQTADSCLYLLSAPATQPLPSTTPASLPSPFSPTPESSDTDLDDWCRDRSLEAEGLDPSLPLDPQYKGKRWALARNITHLIEIIGVERAAFVTFTFREQVSPERAKKVFAKFLRRFRKSWLGHFIKIIEVTRGGQIHIHLVAEIRGVDSILVGTNFDAVERYSKAGSGVSERRWSKRRQSWNEISTNVHLRRIWAELDAILPKMGFGWEYYFFPFLRPEGAAQYLAKSVVQRLPFYGATGRRVQAVRFSSGCPRKVKPRQGPSRWFQLAVNALLGACGQRDESYFIDHWGRRRWAFAIVKMLNPALTAADGFWWGMPRVQLAQLILNLYAVSEPVQYYCDPLISDLMATAAIPQPVAGPPSPHVWQDIPHWLR